MRNCAKCGKPLAEDAKFCSNCGASVQPAVQRTEWDVEIGASVVLKGAANASTTNEVYVPHLGKTIAVSVPNFIQEGKKLRLDGLGKVNAEGKRGALYLRIDHISKGTDDRKREDTRGDSGKRREEWAGTIVKCPSCGQELPSFTAICPACGHEINSAKLASSLREFIDKINEYDKVIANTPKKELPRKGWKSWNTSKRILWLLANILARLIPLVIYLIWPIMRPFFRNNAVPELTSTEQKKAALIENYAFPNDRESVLEALLFMKSKMAFLASERVSESNVYWLRLWSTKAEQLHQKAIFLFPDDAIAETTYDSIVESKKKSDRKVRIRAGMGAAIVAVFCVIVILVGWLPNAGKSPAREDTASTDEQKGSYTYEIRKYVGKNVASIGELSGDYIEDSYGSGSLRLVFVTSDDIYISPDDQETKKNYTVVAQNIEAGTQLTIVHLCDDDGEPYSSLVDYQSYDEIVLYVAPIGETEYTPVYEDVSPTVDRHTYHIRDYIGRNAASFGIATGDGRIDEYGAGELRLAFTSDDGTYVEINDINELRKYIVIAQDIPPDTALEFEYETDSRGNEYDSLLRNQSYEEINLTVKRLDDNVIAKMPAIGFERGTYQELVIENIVMELPNYWEEEESKDEQLRYYANNINQDDQIMMLTIAYPEETDDDYDVSFDGLYIDNENMIDSLNMTFPDGNVFDYEIIESEYAIKGIIYQFTYTHRIDLFTSSNGSGCFFCFPSERDRRWFYVVMRWTNDVESDSFVEDYMTMISTIREKD